MNPKIRVKTIVMKKYRFRLIVSVFIYIFFKITSTDCAECLLRWDIVSMVYLFYTTIVVLIAWEVIATTINYFNDRKGINSNSDLLKISLKAGIIILPLVILFSYISYKFIGPWLHEKEEVQDLWVMATQGFVLCQIIILYEIIRIYIRHAVKEASEKEQIKKELAKAKYEGLKNQVNPHFLFNSFSVLSSLVESDSSTAVKFISKLSDMYRYILENDERSSVTVKEELGFLEHYLFLLEMRHKSAIIIERDLEKVDLNTKIPPMSLQVLIENAVKHNLFSKDDPLTISIYADKNNIIQVSNKKSKKKEVAKSTGIGLSNLSKRLKLLVGKGLTIVEDDESFKVSIPLS